MEILARDVAFQHEFGKLCGKSYPESMKATVNEKGQVTIPKRLRESLGIRAGTELQFEENAGRLIASPVHSRDPIEMLVGLLPRMNVDRTLTELRGPSLDEDPNRKVPRHHRR